MKVVRYYIRGLGCTRELKKRLKNENELMLEYQKNLLLNNPANMEKNRRKIDQQKIDINNIKNGLLLDVGERNHAVCVNGSWQNIISVYMNRGFVTTEGNDKQLEFIKGKIIEEISDPKTFVLIIGVSFGGMVANKLYEMLQEMLEPDICEKVRVITINSIQISQNPKIMNYMHIGDIALKTSRLNTPPPRYLDRVIMKGSEPLIRYSSRRTGNIVWYCYPSKEKKTLGKCKHVSHVSFFNIYSHRSNDYETIVEILLNVNEVANGAKVTDKYFDSNLITLMEKLADYALLDEHNILQNYKIEHIDSIRIKRTQGGKRVKRNKTLKYIQ